MPYVAFHFLVLCPILHPVAARNGEMLVVRPGHPDRPIVVMHLTSDGWRPVRVGPPNYGAVICREDDGVIRSLDGASSSLASHPLVQSA